jgi:hypothetical protein
VSVSGEVILPRRVVPQPTPNLNPGGDCAACVLAGVLGIPVGEVYEKLAGGKVAAPSWDGQRDRILEAQQLGLVDRFIDDLPLWPNVLFGNHMWFGLPARSMAMPWFHYLRMALEAGYYGIAEVCHTKDGPLGIPDHQVLLCGAREVRRPIPAVPGAARIDQEVLVSCSSRTTPDEEWVEACEFLTRRGGFALYLVRPAGGAR